jgi:hypothetical protein
MADDDYNDMDMGFALLSTISLSLVLFPYDHGNPI